MRNVFAKQCMHIYIHIYIFTSHTRGFSLLIFAAAIYNEPPAKKKLPLINFKVKNHEISIWVKQFID